MKKLHLLIVLFFLTACSVSKDKSFVSDFSVNNRKPEGLQVYWFEREAIADLGFIVAVEEKNRNKFVNYYNVGRVISEGEYKDNALILVEYYPDSGYTSDRCFYRLIQKLDKEKREYEYIFLSSYYTALDDNDMLSEEDKNILQQMRNAGIIFDDDLKIADLEFPEIVSIEGSEYGLKLNEFSLGSGVFFDDFNCKPVFVHPHSGSFYSCLENSLNPDGYKFPQNLFLKSFDGTRVLYNLDSDFLNQYEPRMSIWNQSYAVIPDRTIEEKEIESIGKNEFGETLYAFRDENNPILKDYFEMKQPKIEVLLNMLDAPEEWIDLSEQSEYYDLFQNNEVYTWDDLVKIEGEKGDLGGDLFVLREGHPLEEIMFEGYRLNIFEGGTVIGRIPLTYEEYLEKQPLVFWKDPFGRLLWIYGYGLNQDGRQAWD